MRRSRHGGRAAVKAYAAIAGTAVLVLVLTPQPLFAYLDPGSGSMILQIVLGGIAGAAVALKLFWQRLVMRFRSKGDAPTATGTPPPAE